MDDRKRIEQLVEKYGAGLYRYCFYALGGDADAARDVLGEVWLVMLKKAPGLDLGASIHTYLYRVADNCIKHELSAAGKRKKHERPLDEWAERSGDKLIVYDEYFKDGRGDDELLDALATRFSERERGLFVMRFIEKKTLREISDITGESISTVAFRIGKIKEYAKEIINNL